MERITFLLLATVTLAGVVAHMAPASGQADEEAAPIFVKESERQDASHLHTIVGERSDAPG